jgi:hypothetical protein
MKALLSLDLLIQNPLEIYNYDKVLLNDTMWDIGSNERNKITNYIWKIFEVYNEQYLKSFKYFIKICVNLEFQFTYFYNYTILHFIITTIIIRYYDNLVFMELKAKY